MKFLLDTSADTVRARLSDLVCGQLLTPLTNYKRWDGVFAIDNGAFSGFDSKAFARLLERNKDCADKCLFVSLPDVVASARRTLEIYKLNWEYKWIPTGYKRALVAQDGIEDLDIPWTDLDAIFIGGGDPWKDSKSSLDVVRAAKILGKHVHVGRVNTARRFKLFQEAGADTCDGTGVVRFPEMLQEIRKALNTNLESPSLFEDNKEAERLCAMREMAESSKFPSKT